MYAVIETGGKQYRVELGTELAVERLDALPGTTINLERVLLVADGEDSQIGTPTVADALVTADVVRQDRGEKIIVFKYRPKARHRSKRGHRQEQTVLRVADIRFNGRSAADEAGTQKTDKQAEREQAKQEAERKAAADQALAAKLAADTAAEEKPAPATKTEATDAKPAAKASASKPAAKTTPKATAAKPTTSKPVAAPKAKAAAKPAAEKAAPRSTAGSDEKPKTSRTRSTTTKKDE